jgi:mono/diheme cytochrome c family protein
MKKPVLVCLIASLASLIIAVTIIAQAPSANATPTFNKDIAPIVYQNCAICHRTGEVAPFPLLTYQDVSKRARLIATVTEKRYMPPWKAEHGYGEFANERRLSDEQIAKIRAWADGGAPEGNAADKPQPPVFADGWLGGQPDKVLTLPVSYSLAADGPDRFQCFVLPMDLDRDAFVSGLEFRPENRRVVHHALVFLDPNDNARKLADANGQYPCFGGPKFQGALIGGWAPGSVPLNDREAGLRPIPKGSDIVIQIHYHPSGKAEVDRSSLGLRFTDRPGTTGRTAVILFNRRIDIAPGDSHYVVKSSLVMPRDVKLAGISPHAHYLGKEMKISAHLPDGSEKPLIWIKDWDFNWQGAYQYVTPVTLPKGTRVDLEYTYNNSENNPRNPAHPPVRVRWGEQTTDEMAVAFLSVILPPLDIAAFQQEIVNQYVEQILGAGANLDDLPPELSAQQRQGLTLAFNLFDANHDGKLDPEESAAIIQFLRLRR